LFSLIGGCAQNGTAVSKQTSKSKADQEKYSDVTHYRFQVSGRTQGCLGRSEKRISNIEPQNFEMLFYYAQSIL